MKNPDTKTLDTAIARRLNGEAWGTILEGTGLSHSQAERHEFRFKMWLYATGDKTIGDWGPISPDAEGVVAARQAGISWGVIGERAGLPESRVRKLFAESTNVKSKGLRIGKGGRFAYDDEALYTPNPKAGIAIPASMSHKPELRADGTSIKGLSAEQKADLEAIGMATLRERVQAARDRNKK